MRIAYIHVSTQTCGDGFKLCEVILVSIHMSKHWYNARVMAAPGSTLARLDERFEWYQMHCLLLLHA